jgi:hypothetical protein
MKNRVIANVNSKNFLGVVIGSTLSQEKHTERTCSRISSNLFIKTSSKILDLNERRMLYYCLIYLFLLCGIVVWGQVLRHSLEEFLFSKKSAVRYTAGLRHLESCRDSFRHLKILTVYSLYIEETILYVKKSVSAQ